MVKDMLALICDACKKQVEIDRETKEYPEKWIKGCEIGDLCPSCANAWKNYKQSFIEKMRIENKEGLN